MGLGSTSLPHQQWCGPGCSTKVELQPGQRQPSGWFGPGFSSRSFAWFVCHFFTQWRCVTVQQMEQDHTLEFRRTSFVQMTHSYWRLSISSWIRVGRSAAADFGISCGTGCRRCCGTGAGRSNLRVVWISSGSRVASRTTNLGAGLGWPGTNSAAAALSPGLDKVLPPRPATGGGIRPPRCDTMIERWPVPPRPRLPPPPCRPVSPRPLPKWFPREGTASPASLEATRTGWVPFLKGPGWASVCPTGGATGCGSRLPSLEAADGPGPLRWPLLNRPLYPPLPL